MAWLFGFLSTASAFLATAAFSQQIERVGYDDLAFELVELVDFENLPRRSSPGQVLDGVADFDGLQLAERFRGQLVVQDRGFDRLLDVPSAPLALEPGAPGQSLAVEFVYFLSNLVMGMAPPGFPDRAAGGEGAIAVLFDRDQSALGFRVASEPKPKEDARKGKMQVAFYRRDGALIDAVDVELEWMLAGYGFRRVGLVEDIAGITITNQDPQGLMIDDVIFDRRLVLGFALPQ